ncbi:MAG: hypothetical protein AB1638_00770 [Nitrospirota bacterium]
MIKDRRIFLVIFLTSLSSLAYEITLTRIFSISLWYHFAFMIISIAMLGLGASGTILSLNPKLRNLSNTGIYSLLLGTSISLSYLLSNQIPFDPVRLPWDRMQLLYIGFYYVALSIPFFFTGLIIATAFTFISEKSGLLYGADLLGAGTGSLGVLYLLTILVPDRAVFVISSIAFLSAFIASGKRLRIISSITILLTFSVLILDPSFTEIRISPYKGLQVALRYPGAEHLKTYLSPFSRIDTFKSSAVRFAPGLSLRYLESLPEQIGFSIDGGDINAITSKGEGKSFSRSPLEFLKYLPSALPYKIGSTKDVLILDPKGGLQILVAEYYGSSNIYKIESNSQLIEVIKKDLGELSGRIYSQNTWSGLGRSWLSSDFGRFDIIDISLMGAVPSGSFGISEDYRFTVEAFREYIDHLKPEGLLSINLFILPPPRIEFRLINTIVTSLEGSGIKGVEKHIVALRTWGSICILVKKSPLSINETEVIKKFSKEMWFDLIYYPGIKEEESNVYVRMPSNEYFFAFKSILNPETRSSFVNRYIFDIRPVSDDRPFFHYYLKLKNIKDIYKIMGEKWQYFIEEGYILPAVFVQVLFLSLLLILLPAITKLKVKAKGKNVHQLLPYFAFLGIGFMFIEVSLIQKLILPLEHPSYAVATVLTSILISSGIGSLLSYRISCLRSPHIIVVLTFIIILYSLFIPAITNVISPYPITLKIASVFLIFMPLGLFMGIPFPLGLRILGEKNESLIPWAWAINGCLSVLAPILTILLAISTGFKMVLWFGAASYLMAYSIIRIFLKRPT